MSHDREISSSSDATKQGLCIRRLFDDLTFGFDT